MSYLVTVCDGCQAVALTAAPRLSGKAPRCETCEVPLRIVPSRMYHESERSLFTELSQALTESAMSSTEAEGWIRRVTRALVDRSYLDCWESLSNRFPGLFSRHVLLGGNLRAHETALQLVRTIIEAVSMTRRSGTMQAVKLTQPSKSKTG